MSGPETLRGADGRDWECVVGLEVHAELATASKLFSAAPNAFGAAPNTNIDPVSLGLPGTLPVVNRHAVELAVRFGLAVGATIGRAIFHRKNYFYPDMPKDFQISQYDEPICAGGSVTTIDVDGTARTVRLVRAHLEEDAGKLVHVGGGGRIDDADHSLVDYNRAGVPLLEIVSEPDIRSSEQARAYAAELRAVLSMLGVSDVKMEEGSMRVDANVSVRPVGDTTLGTRCEIKNMNSLRSLQRAVRFEFERQVAVVSAGGVVDQETRHWDEADGRTHPMRSKEEANDYRYFPEPDLVPIVPEPAWVERIAATLPAELPAAAAQRLIAEYDLSAELVLAVVYTPGLADFVRDEIAAGADAKSAFVWASQDVLAVMNEDNASFADLRLPSGAFVELSAFCADGTLSGKLARQVLATVLATGDAPAQVVEREGLAQISDDDELARIVAEVIAADPATAEKYRAGNTKVLGAYVGKVMQATGGRANPQRVNELLRAELDAG